MSKVTVETINSFFPQLAEVKDRRLAEAASEIWVEAFENSSWDDIEDAQFATRAPVVVFFASTFWRKMQNIFGECCISKLEKVARPRLAAILPAT